MDPLFTHNFVEGKAQTKHGPQPVDSFGRPFMQGVGCFHITGSLRFQKILTPKKCLCSKKWLDDPAFTQAHVVCFWAVCTHTVIITLG